jgi:uncharacterized protein
MKEDKITESHIANKKKLEDILRSLSDTFPKLYVAISGGLDSTVLLYLAHSIKLPNFYGFHASSPSVSNQSKMIIQELKDKYGLPIEVVFSNELNDFRYSKNDNQRCYFCKHNLYSSIQARLKPNERILSGLQTDDLLDYRPGMKAASEHQVLHPYIMANINKSSILYLSKIFGLEEKLKVTSGPCLSSRVKTGIPIDSQILNIIDMIETKIKEVLGLNFVRARYVGPMSFRIEFEGSFLFGLKSVEKQKLEKNLNEILTQYLGTLYSFSIDDYMKSGLVHQNTILSDILNEFSK